MKREGPVSNGTAKRLKNHAVGGKDSKGPRWSTYVGPCRRRRKGEETAKNLLLPSDVQLCTYSNRPP